MTATPRHVRLHPPALFLPKPALAAQVALRGLVLALSLAVVATEIQAASHAAFWHAAPLVLLAQVPLLVLALGSALLSLYSMLRSPGALAMRHPAVHWAGFAMIGVLAQLSVALLLSVFICS